MLNLANRTLSANTNRLNLGTRSLAAPANVNIDLALVRGDQAQHAQVKRPDRIPFGKKPSIIMWMGEPSGPGWRMLASWTSLLATETPGGRGCWESKTVANAHAEAPPVVRPVVVVDDRSTDRYRATRIRSHSSMRMYSPAAHCRAVRAAAFSATTQASRLRFGG